MQKCIKCGVELTDENWYLSQRLRNSRTCKSCCKIIDKKWRKENPEKTKRIYTKSNHKRNVPMSKNKKCPLFLGCYVAERVLKHVFHNVKMMPHGNPGFDFICNGGYEIDVKAACMRYRAAGCGHWGFHIRKNKIADYFLCLAFDDLENLNPLHIWLLPADKFNHLNGIGISETTVSKWDKYRLDINKVVSCCNIMKGGLNESNTTRNPE